MSDFRNTLEEYVVERLKEIDPCSKKTPGSGCGASLGDVSNQYFFVECKQKRTKANIIVDYKKEYLDLVGQMPLNTKKVAIIVTENKFGDKFVTLDADDFFDLTEEAKNCML